jgi:hypothetical protein
MFEKRIDSFRKKNIKIFVLYKYNDISLFSLQGNLKPILNKDDGKGLFIRRTQKTFWL